MTQPKQARPATPSGRPRQWVPVRRLGPQHRARVVEHLLALSDADRLLRFGHIASDALIERYADQINFAHDEVFGTFNRRLKIVAMAHLAFGAEHEGTVAEFGVSVLSKSRGQGLGSKLFDHAVVHARNRGVRTMVIHLARDNAPMLLIVRRAGAVVRFEGSDAWAELPLPADTLGTQIEEMLGRQAAEWDYRLKLQALRLDAFRPAG